MYCYMHWQDSYNTLKSNVEFHQGLPSAQAIKKLQNTLIVLDDLMDAAVKDPGILSTFTEGSHHKRLSVIFLMQNIFHKGLNTRTINLNVQYMILFKNARDQQQIQTLARQMFPSSCRKFLEHYEEATSQPYGHVIVDLHPSTSDEKRIVHESRYESSSRLSSEKSNDEKKSTESNVQDLMEQHYSLLNPYADSLLKAKQKMDNILEDPTIPNDRRQVMHGEAMDEYLTLRKRYDLNQPASGNAALKKSELVKEYKPELVKEYKPILGAKRKYEEPNQFKQLHPPGIPNDGELKPEDVPLPSDSEEWENEDYEKSLMQKDEYEKWKIPRTGEDKEWLDFLDTDEETKSKLKYSQRVNTRSPPRPYISDSEVDPSPLDFDDTPEERKRKTNYTRKYHLRSKADRENFGKKLV